MTLTVRRRVLIAVVTGLVLGYLYFGWAFQLGLNLVHTYHDAGYIQCRGRWWDLGYSCDPSQFSALSGWIELVAASIVLLVILAGLIVWTLRPIRQMTAAVARLGPQNLGERNAFAGPRDEVRELADAIDAMMDRVSEGYEGQRRFAANASHELRTPLAVQRTLIEVSMAGEPSGAEISLLASQLLATNERNEALIEGLLVLAESDRGLVSRTPQRLDQIVEATIQLYQPMADKARVRILATLQPAVVTGEQVLLERLVSNLIHNAIKYNVEDGSIQLTVGPDPTLTVSNTGHRVPAESIGSIFEPFRRLSGERIDHGGGAGLGLTIVRSVVQAHGGTVQAWPGADGGITVEVALAPPEVLDPPAQSIDPSRWKRG
jgi:signal transduction histidine kinase